jgi:hypothetical protein
MGWRSDGHHVLVFGQRLGAIFVGERIGTGTEFFERRSFRNDQQFRGESRERR